MKSHKNMQQNILLLFLMILLLPAFLLASCGPAAADIDYGDHEIRIAGLADEEFTVTVNELMALDSVTQKAEAGRFNGERVQVKATGPTLETFLAGYGKKPSDFSLVRFSAADRYAIAMTEEILADRDIILAFSEGGGPLPEDSIPIRVVVPGERAMYWVRMLSKIEFETGEAMNAGKRVIFLDNALPAAGGIWDETAQGLYITVEELVELWGGGSGQVLMEAGDGLKKKETMDNFLKGRLKYTGEKAIQFYSPDLPEGMHIDGVLSIQCGDTLFYALAEAEAMQNVTAADGRQGIPFSNIVKNLSFTAAFSYRLTDSFGDESVLSEQEMSEGLFCPAEEGWDFQMANGRRISGILSVESVLSQQVSK